MDEDWGIIYYQAVNQSSSPIQDFIQSLDVKARAKVGNSLNLLEEFGTKLSFSHIKKLTGTELWELRILGQDNLRILYVAVTGKNFLLLHGFSKKKQKTDKREIGTALARLKEYRSRVAK